MNRLTLTSQFLFLRRENTHYLIHDAVLQFLEEFFHNFLLLGVCISKFLYFCSGVLPKGFTPLLWKTI